MHKCLLWFPLALLVVAPLGCVDPSGADAEDAQHRLGRSEAALHIACEPGDREACHWRGECNAEGTQCVCDDPTHWSAEDHCRTWHPEQPAPGQLCVPGRTAHCSHNGVCNLDGDGCTCGEWWNGPTCAVPADQCPGYGEQPNGTWSQDVCSGRGECVEAGVCECDEGFAGPECADAEDLEVTNVTADRADIGVADITSATVADLEVTQSLTLPPGALCDSDALCDGLVTLDKLGVSGTPAAGQHLGFDGSGLAWTPLAPPGVATLGGVRASQCAPGELVSGLGTDGNVICAPDATGTGGGTEYTAGSGLALQGNEFSVAPGGINDTHVAAGSLHPARINGTAATLTGSQSFDQGTLVVHAGSDRVGIGVGVPGERLDVDGTVRADGYRLRTPQNRRVMVPSTEFRHFFGQGGLVHRGDFARVGTGRLTAVATIQIPPSMIINQLACYFYDNHVGSLWETSSVELRARHQSAVNSTRVATLVTPFFQTANVVRTERVNFTHTVQPNTHLTLLAEFETISPNLDLRFYGCSVRYRALALVP